MPAHATMNTCATVGACSLSRMRGDSILGRNAKAYTQTIRTAMTVASTASE